MCELSEHCHRLSDLVAQEAFTLSMSEGNRSTGAHGSDEPMKTCLFVFPFFVIASCQSEAEVIHDESDHTGPELFLHIFVSNEIKMKSFKGNTLLVFFICMLLLLVFTLNMAVHVQAQASLL